MNRRFRTLAALVALLAFALSGAESLWASVCSAEMQKPAEAAADAGCRTGMAPSDAHKGSGGRDASAPDCPFVGLGASGCIAPVGFPAATVPSLAAYPGDALPVRLADHARLLLLATGLFHPPRA